MLVLSILYLLLSTSQACPGPDCEETYNAPPNAAYITTTERCTGPDGCYREPTPPPQHPVVTITSHRCASKSIVPYTSSSSTFWLSSVTCSTLSAVTSWLAPNDTCIAPQSCGSASTIYQNVTLPASTALSVTTVKWPITHTVFASGSAPATVTLPASTLPQATETTILQGSCAPNEIFHPASTVYGITTELTTGSLKLLERRDHQF